MDCKRIDFDSIVYVLYIYFPTNILFYIYIIHTTAFLIEEEFKIKCITYIKIFT